MWKFTAFASAFALIFAAAPALGEDTSAQPSLPPKPEASAAKEVLLVPSRTGTRTEIDRTAIDILLRTAIERFDVRLIMQAPRTQACGQHGEALSRIQSAYLDMNIDKALEQARALRASIEADFGDVFDCDALTQAELLSVQMLLDLEQASDAEKLAQRILARRPLLSLDPVEYPPKMQALWARLARSDAPIAPKRPSTTRLRRLSEAHGARFVVFGRAFRQEGRDVLEVTVIDATVSEPTRALVPLSASSPWMADVRSALSQILPSAQVPQAEEAPDSPPSLDLGVPIPPRDDDVDEASPPFYKRWWFWTAVGIVVVGAAAGAITAYSVANHKPTTAVEIDPWSSGDD